VRFVELRLWDTQASLRDYRTALSRNATVDMFLLAPSQ